MIRDIKKRPSGRLISILAILIMICSADLSFGTAQNITYHENEIEASSELRENMKKRVSSVIVGIEGKTDQEGLQKIIGRMIGEATEHTGKPDEGDYILFQYASYKGQARTKLSGTTPVVEIEYDLSYYDNAEQEAEVDSKAEEIIKELDLEDLSDYDKISAIHDYICDNVEYEASVDGSDIMRTAYGALVEGRAVCQGYSVSLYRLLLEAGIDNRIIFGTGVSPIGITGAHTWNIVDLYGEYYYMDVTWDDCTGSRDYFLVPAGDDFEKEHVADSQYGEDFFTERYPLADEAFNKKMEGLLSSLEGMASTITDVMKGLINDNKGV